MARDGYDLRKVSGIGSYTHGSPVWHIFREGEQITPEPMAYATAVALRERLELQMRELR